MQQIADKEKQDLAVYYHACRHRGRRAAEAYIEARKIMGKTEEWCKDNLVAGHLLKSLLPIAISVCMPGMAFRDLQGYAKDGLWITSKSRKTVVQLPFKLAMRVIKKRGWQLAEVGPVKPERIICRKEAVRILVLGDKDRANGS